MNDILDALCEAGFDLNVHLHADGRRRLRVHLQAPDENLRLVSGCADQELVALVALLTHDHWRWVLEAQDLGDTFLTAGMSIKDLLDGWGVVVWIDVPNLELAVQSTNKEMIFIDLVEEGWVLVVVNLVLDALHTRLDIDVADEHLLVVEAGDSEDG